MSTAARRRGRRLGAESVRFRFDGRQLEAQAGDSVASALLANGIRLAGRSVKYRRARGIFSAGLEEPNALLSIGAPPRVISNVPAPQLLVSEGLDARSQNRWPSLRWNVHSLLQLGGGLFGAGFYYKTFMWPNWRAYEGLIRRLAGLGEAPGDCDLPRVDTEHVPADVLVAGGGPAGLSAALAASRAGARVVLCEREAVCSGELDFETATIGGVEATRWVDECVRELQSRGARVLTNTAVVGGTDGLIVAHRQSGGLVPEVAYRFRPRSFVIAMGAVERSIAFADNDLPGVMLLGAAERYLARYGVKVGSNPVLFGNHDRLYAAASRMLAAGIRVRAIVDTRDETQAPSSADAREELRRIGVECLPGHTLVAAHGRFGVRGVTLAHRSVTTERWTLPCDAVLVSGGWSPTAHAGLHDGGIQEIGADGAGFVATHQPDWRRACGSAAGQFDLGSVVADGWRTGQRAASHLANGTLGEPPIAVGDAQPRLIPFWRAPATPAEEKRQFVDLQNDVTVADLRLALAEGFTNIEHIKRYTTLGIGTEQGRTSGVLGAAIVAELSGQALPQVGTSRTRPPYQPATLMALCGSRVGMDLRPDRRTPLHEQHIAHRAVLDVTGLWHRPRYYADNGRDAFTAGIVEAKRVRATGGIFDASTLGKIEVVGPDAAAFLDYVYLTPASTIKVGRSKYMVNLREDGMVLDDGLVLRLAPDRFLATVSSAHAGHMLSHFEFWRETQAAARSLAITDVTEAWAVVVVAGPKCREALRSALGTAWYEPLSSLTHMSFVDGKFDGADVRMLRASFSGELAYELHCRPRVAVAVWKALIAAGLQPYGLEAVDILRLEKGYLLSSEINGQTTPQDLGMDALLRVGNPCVGRALLDREAFSDPDRPRLVGLRAVDNTSKFSGGAQITPADAPTRSAGYVTSTAFSPHLSQWIGLGLVSRRIAKEGSEVLVRDFLRGGDVRALVTSPVHFDAEGTRMKS
jgi:methylglutamate dehydrogenase subunit C